MPKLISATPSKVSQALFTKASLSLLAWTTCAYSEVFNEFAVSAGYRQDTIKQNYTRSGSSYRVEFDNIRAYALEGNYLVSFNHNLYLRGMGTFAKALGHLRKRQNVDGVESLNVRGNRSHMEGWLGAGGWQFDFGMGRYALCLEGGYLYNSIKYIYETNHHLKLYAPFIGTLIHLPLNRRWYLECDFDYIFASTRHERVEGVDFNEGPFQGPRGGLALGAHLGEHISCALDWKTFYFFSDHRSMGTIVNERTQWTMQQFTAQFSCRF